MYKLVRNGSMVLMEEKRKKVLFVVTKSGLGGASRSVRELAEGLSETADVAVAAGGAGELFTVLAEKNIRTIPIPDLGRDISLVKETRSFLFFIDLFKNEAPDVVHLHSPKAGGLGALAARIVGVKKIIYTAHGWAFFEDRPWWQKILIRLFSYVTVLLTTTTIAVSKKDAHAFRGWPFIKNKMVHIPNGVSVATPLSRTEAREKLGLKADTFVIGTIAELHKNKGLIYLIEAVEKIPNAIFVIIGEGEERKRLQLSIAAHRLEDRITLAGYIPEAHTLIPAFDIFVLPSVKEGLPYVLLEAGARGKPVVATNVGGIPEIIEDGKTGFLVPPKNPNALAQALTRLQNDSPIRTLLAENIQKKVSKEFSFKLMIENISDIYEAK